MSAQALLLLLSSQLRMSEHATALALLYLHKLATFTAVQASTIEDSSLDPVTAALACLSLAAKTAEQSRRLRELIVPAYQHVHPGKPSITYPSEAYDTIRASLVNAEGFLLRVLQFDVRLTTPFEYLPRLLTKAVLFEPAQSEPEGAKRRDAGFCRAEETPLGILSRVLCLEGLQQRQVALFFTAKTIAASAILRALQRMHISFVYGSKEPEVDAVDFVAKACRVAAREVQECLDAFP